LFADDPAGAHRVPTFVHHANKKLAAIGQRIVSSGGPGSTYRLEFFSARSAGIPEAELD
jgi:hypothetical protein